LLAIEVTSFDVDRELQSECRRGAVLAASVVMHLVVLEQTPPAVVALFP
jgi:hypothetical protein